MKSHYIGNSNTIVKYQYGNVSVQDNDTMSFSLVFRVVKKYADYNCYTDTIISTINSNTTKENSKYDARTKLYSACDKHHHHALLKQIYKKIRS